MLAPFSGGAQLIERTEAPLDSEVGLVDEDEDQLVEKQYVFNPILAKKELKVGNFYARKGKHQAAAARYLEATRWDPNYADAYWKLGRSREKLEQSDAALEAYRKCLSLEPSGRHANNVRKKIAVLMKPLRAKGERARETP